MGGPGSGQYPGNSTENMRGGRPKKAAVSVCGTGVPVMPKTLPDSVAREWTRIEEMTRGVAFEQDSDAVTELAWLTWLQEEKRTALLLRPLDGETNRQYLAIGRSLRELWGQFGLTPRSRQVLLVPKEDQPELDPLEQLQSGYD